MQRHGINRRPHRIASGSTPHDRVTIPPIGSSRSPALDQPRQSAPRYPPAVANRSTIYRIRRRPPLIRQSLHRRTTCSISSIPTNQLFRGTQIPIAPAARPYVPLSAVSSLGGFRTPAPPCAAPPSWGRHPKPFTTAVVALVHNSETSSLTLALSCAQNESGNSALVSGRAPLLGMTMVPEAVAIHQLSSPLGSSFLPSWHRRHLAEYVRLRYFLENAPTWFRCTIDAGSPL